jgi:GNAT superfamily N-acetyltransferase
MRAVTFRPYTALDRETCLAIFDANCPEYFAPNERADFAEFLAPVPSGYQVCETDGRVVGAFGLMGDPPDHCRLNWILLDPAAQGAGVGSAMMGRVASAGRDAGVGVVRIAASHKSAPFFARFGARPVRVTKDGWGPDMHRHDMELLLRGSDPPPAA